MFYYGFSNTFIFYFLESFNYRMIIIALMTSIFCQIGDLIFSFLKRKAKKKIQEIFYQATVEF